MLCYELHDIELVSSMTKYELMSERASREGIPTDVAAPSQYIGHVDMPSNEEEDIATVTEELHNYYPEPTDLRLYVDDK